MLQESNMLYAAAPGPGLESWFATNLLPETTIRKA